MSEVEATPVSPTPLELARIAKQQKAQSGISTTRMNPVEKAKANPRSKALAIRAMCYQCVGGELVVQQVRNCASDECALHPHRPYQVGSKDADDLIEVIDVTDEPAVQQDAVAVTEPVITQVVPLPAAETESSVETTFFEPQAETAKETPHDCSEQESLEHRMWLAIELEEAFDDYTRLTDAIALEDAFNWLDRAPALLAA